MIRKSSGCFELSFQNLASDLGLVGYTYEFFGKKVKLLGIIFQGGSPLTPPRATRGQYMRQHDGYKLIKCAQDPGKSLELSESSLRSRFGWIYI